jgi:hypothetical protein
MLLQGPQAPIRDVSTVQEPLSDPGLAPVLSGMYLVADVVLVADAISAFGGVAASANEIRLAVQRDNMRRCCPRQTN